MQIDGVLSTQNLTIYEVSPRMLYASSMQSVQLWLYGIGFNNLRHHQFFCILRGNASANQDVNISLQGEVFSNFRASCLFSHNDMAKFSSSPAALEKSVGGYTLSVLVRGAPAAPASSTLPPPFLSETSDFLAVPRTSKTYYVVSDCTFNCSRVSLGERGLLILREKRSIVAPCPLPAFPGSSPLSLRVAVRREERQSL